MEIQRCVFKLQVTEIQQPSGFGFGVSDQSFIIDDRKSIDPADTAPPRRGRPKLGVVSREVTLLPRHWDWLSRQRGGASAALRRLVDDARKAQESSDQTRQRQEAAHKFMTAMAGDLPNFEEALRSLYRGDAQSFDQFVRKWPDDIRSTATQMAFPEG